MKPGQAFCPQPDRRTASRLRYSAWTGWHRAREAGGTFRVRIETSISPLQARNTRRDADLKWLGLDWEARGTPQSEHFHLRKVLDLLDQRLALSCFCSRAEIEREIAASANAPHGPDGPLYPRHPAGICRCRSDATASRPVTELCLRLDCGHAAKEPGLTNFFDESHRRHRGPACGLMGDFGDRAQGRRPAITSGHGRRSPAGRNPGDPRNRCAAFDPRPRLFAQSCWATLAPAICGMHRLLPTPRAGVFAKRDRRHDHPWDARKRMSPDGSRRARTGGAAVAA